MGEFRLVRLGEQIRAEISKMLLSGQIKDPRVSSFLSINRVDVSADLGYAKIQALPFPFRASCTRLAIAEFPSNANSTQFLLSKIS